MKDVIREIKKYVEDHQLEMPEDMKRLFSRNPSSERTMAAAIYAVGEVSSASNFLHFAYTNAMNGTGELETLKKMTEDYLVYVGGLLTRWYTMNDGSAMVLKAAEAVKTVSSCEEFVELTAAVNQYFSQMFFWIDICFPWHETGRAFGEALAERPLGGK